MVHELGRRPWHEQWHGVLVGRGDSSLGAKIWIDQALSQGTGARVPEGWSGTHLHRHVQEGADLVPSLAEPVVKGGRRWSAGPPRHRSAGTNASVRFLIPGICWFLVGCACRLSPAVRSHLRDGPLAGRAAPKVKHHAHSLMGPARFPSPDWLPLRPRPNGTVTTESLNGYARQRVIDLTGGRQKPPLDVIHATIWRSSMSSRDSSPTSRVGLPIPTGVTDGVGSSAAPFTNTS